MSVGLKARVPPRGRAVRRGAGAGDLAGLGWAALQVRGGVAQGARRDGSA